jgi:hypothetical protein
VVDDHVILLDKVTGSILASDGGIPPLFVKFYPYKPKFVLIREKRSAGSPLL